MARVLLMGCGDIGSELAAVLVAQGHQVVAAKRTDPIQSVPGVDYVRCDLTRPDQLQRISCQVDQVFVVLAPGERSENGYQAVYGAGLARLFSHFASQVSRPHWIFVSSTSVYAQNAGEWVDENSATVPQAFNGRCLLQAEQLLYEHDASATVVRFSGIYGPGRSGLLQSVVQGKPVQYQPYYYTNRFHARDCVGLLAYLLARRLAGIVLEKCYLASDDAPVPMGELAIWLARQLGCAAPPPKALDQISGAQNKRCRNDKIKALGYPLCYADYQQGYRELIKLHRNNTV